PEPGAAEGEAARPGRALALRLRRCVAGFPRSRPSSLPAARWRVSWHESFAWRIVNGRSSPATRHHKMPGPRLISQAGRRASQASPALVEARPSDGGRELDSHHRGRFAMQVEREADRRGEVRTAHRRRVLLIDDDREILELLAEWLRGRGHEVRTLVDGTCAVVEARSFRPHVVVL